MFLDGGEATDPVAVAVGFIVFDKQANHLVLAPIES